MRCKEDWRSYSRELARRTVCIGDSPSVREGVETSPTPAGCSVLRGGMCFSIAVSASWAFCCGCFQSEAPVPIDDCGLPVSVGLLSLAALVHVYCYNRAGRATGMPMAFMNRVSCPVSFAASGVICFEPLRVSLPAVLFLLAPVPVPRLLLRRWGGSRNSTLRAYPKNW